MPCCTQFLAISPYTKESVVTAGKQNTKKSRSPRAASVTHRKNRRCWRTSWRTLRIYLRADSPRTPWAKLRPVRPSELILGGFCFRVGWVGVEQRFSVAWRAVFRWGFSRSGTNPQYTIALYAGLKPLHHPFDR